MVAGQEPDRGVIVSVWGTRLSLDGTWPEDRQPIRYQGSHRVPTADDPRGGLLDTASISSELTADGKDDGPADDTPLPFLRVAVAERVVTREDAQPGELLGTAPGMQTVILDAGQVRELRDDLTDWFHAPEDDGRRSWVCTHCGGSGEEPDPPTAATMAGVLGPDWTGGLSSTEFVRQQRESGDGDA